MVNDNASIVSENSEKNSHYFFLINDLLKFTLTPIPRCIKQHVASLRFLVSRPLPMSQCMRGLHIADFYLSCEIIRANWFSWQVACVFLLVYFEFVILLVGFNSHKSDLTDRQIHLNTTSNEMYNFGVFSGLIIPRSIVREMVERLNPTSSRTNKKKLSYIFF